MCLIWRLFETGRTTGLMPPRNRLTASLGAPYGGPGLRPDGEKARDGAARSSLDVLWLMVGGARRAGRNSPIQKISGLPNHLVAAERQAERTAESAEVLWLLRED
jgi:hypothetical protein